MRKIRIQSFSDVITNSSSELFVVRSNDDAWEELQNKINKIAQAMCDEDDTDNWQYVDHANSDTAKSYRESAYDIDIYEGDHYIYVYENCMPWPLMDIIDEWLPHNDKLTKLNDGKPLYVERYHLG